MPTDPKDLAGRTANTYTRRKARGGGWGANPGGTEAVTRTARTIGPVLFDWLSPGPARGGGACPETDGEQGGRRQLVTAVQPWEAGPTVSEDGRAPGGYSGA